MTKKEQQELKKKAKKAKKIAKKTKKVAKKMGYKKFFLLLVIVIAILVGGFFGYSYYKYQDPFYFFKPQVEEQNKPNAPDVSEGNVFEHQLYGPNMKNTDTMTVNGLTFTFPKMKYDEYDKGIKLGSSKDGISDWSIQTNFDKAVIDSFEFVISNNKNGTTNYCVDFGSIKKEGKSTGVIPKTIIFNDLNVKTTSLKLTISNNSGGYLKSLKIKFNNPPFKVSKDVFDYPAVTPGKNNVPMTNYAVISKEAYYKTIDFTEAGPNLRKALQERLSKDITLTSYEDAKTMLIYTDERVDEKGVLYSVYDGVKYRPEWSSYVLNREHIWPCSRMVLNGLPARPGESDRDHRSDLHNLRILSRSLNIDRSNLYYSDEDREENKTTPGTFFPNKSSNAKDDFRGDVARIIFYMALRYDGLEVVENPGFDTNKMGQLSLLKKWAHDDPVDDFEIQRNNRIYEYQGNRNPFIDYPEILDKLYA